ncbi:hypothetical protein NECAME_13685, partial [Necator americanus]
MPVGDWSCCVDPASDWRQIKEIADRLMSTASDFRLAYDRVAVIPRLIVACRHRLASVRGSLSFHLFASCMLSLSLLFTIISFLPLLFDYDQIFLTVFVQLPCLTVGSVFTPFHPKTNVIRISSKKSTDVQRQSISWAVINFLVGFLPTSLYLVVVFFFLLVGNATVACSFSDVVCSVATDRMSEVPLSTMAIRHIVGFHIFLTVFVQLPCLTVGSVFTPFHPKTNVIRISSKKSTDVQRQSISWAVINFLVGFLPTSLYLVVVFFFLLVSNATVACSFSDVVCSVATDRMSEVPLSTMAIRHIVGLHLALSLCVLSSAWVYPLSSIWNDKPFFCLPWTASCVVCLGSQILFSYVSGVPLHEALSLFSVSAIALWIAVIFTVNELLKLRTI